MFFIKMFDQTIGCIAIFRTFVAGRFFQEVITRKTFIDVTFAITFGFIAFVTAGTMKDHGITHFCWSIVQKVCGKLLQKK